MDYLILTVKQMIQTPYGEVEQLGYVCVNSVSRCKNAQGKDGIQFVSSGVSNWVAIEEVIAITPSTPNYDAVAALRK